MLSFLHRALGSLPRGRAPRVDTLLLSVYLRPIRTSEPVYRLRPNGLPLLRKELAELLGPHAATGSWPVTREYAIAARPSSLQGEQALHDATTVQLRARGGGLDRTCQLAVTATADVDRFDASKVQGGQIVCSESVYRALVASKLPTTFEWQKHARSGGWELIYDDRQSLLDC